MVILHPVEGFGHPAAGGQLLRRLGRRDPIPLDVGADHPLEPRKVHVDELAGRQQSKKPVLAEGEVVVRISQAALEEVDERPGLGRGLIDRA